MEPSEKKCPKCGEKMIKDYEFDYFPGSIDPSMAHKAYWNCYSCNYREIIWNKGKKKSD